MKYSIFFVATLSSLLAACSGGDTSSSPIGPIAADPNVKHKVESTPAPTSSDQQIFAPVRLLTDVDLSNGKIISIETFGWCEPSGNENKSLPCIEHEVGRLSQGNQTTYFARTWNPNKPMHESLESSFSNAKNNSFWNQKSKLWDEQSSVRESTQAKIIHLKFDLPDYLNFLTIEKSINLSRCLSSPDGQALRKQKLSDQGNLVISANGLTALTLRSSGITEALEIDMENGEVVSLAAQGIGFVRDDYADFLYASEEQISSVRELNFTERGLAADVGFEIVHARDDDAIRNFAFACGEAYSRLRGKNNACDLGYYLPINAPDMKIDSKASLLVGDILKKPDVISGLFSNPRFSQTLDGLKEYWERLPPSCSLTPN